MDEKTRKIYSEVYEILVLLGDRFINKLPNKLFDLIEKEKSSLYNPKYNLDIPLENQNVKEETIAIIALLKLKYWCESEEEKKELEYIFQKNEEIYQKNLREIYSYDKLFRKKNFANENKIENTSVIKYKENVIKTIFNKIKKILFKNTKFC